jgi:hypothetical protein
MTTAARGDFWTLFFAGWIWHMLYAVTGFNDTIGLIAPVNESVWEHLKLGYGATLVLMLQDAWRSIRNKHSSSILGRSVAIVAMNIVIVAVFYTYTSIVGRSFVIVDIALYGVASWVAVIVHDRIAACKPSAMMENIGIVLLMIIAALFAWFTMDVPSLMIFTPGI